MTDKYEQFKEWFKHHPTDEDELDLVFAIGNLFKEFEEEYEDKKKKEAVKEVLEKYIQEISIENESGDKIIMSLTADDCYNELKEKDLIK